MFPFKSVFLLASLLFSVAICSNWAEKMTYQPYGPMMCKTLCRDSSDSFSYSVEDLACRRISPRFSGRMENCLANDSFTCFRHRNSWTNGTVRMLTIVKGGDRSTHYLKVEDLSALQPEMTTPTVCSGDSQNISLHQAARDGNICVVKFILSLHPGDINSQDEQGRTPVMLAAEGGHLSLVELLVSQGCNLAITDRSNYTVLHIVCLKGKTDVARYLILRTNCNIESKGWKSYTPVMCAVCGGHRAILDLLMRRCCNLSVVAQGKVNLLHVACIGGHADMVKYILSQKIFDIESRDINRATPLLIAAQLGYRKTYDVLIRAGSDLGAVDNHHNNIINNVALGGSVHMLDYVLKNTFAKDCNGLRHKSAMNGVKAKKRLKEKTATLLTVSVCNFSALNSQGYNMLHLACIHGKRDMLSEIISRGLVDIEFRSEQGFTPLLLAAFTGHTQILKFLITRECNLRAVDKFGNTALHLACYSGYVHIVKYLLSLDEIQKDIVNVNGHTPLSVAKYKGHKEIVAALQKYI